MSDMNPNELDPSPSSFTGVAVAIGRIEEMIKSLAETVKEQATSVRDLDVRVREVENAINRIEAKQVPKQPWYSVVAGIVGIVTGAGSLIALLAILSNLGANGL